MPSHLDFDEKIAMIRLGKAKLISWDKIYHYTDFVQAYKYPQDIERDKIEKENIVNSKKYRDKLSRERDAILDELLLGDAEKALKLIQKFEAFKV